MIEAINIIVQIFIYWSAFKSFLVYDIINQLESFQISLKEKIPFGQFSAIID